MFDDKYKNVIVFVNIEVRMIYVTSPHIKLGGRANECYRLF